MLRTVATVAGLITLSVAVPSPERLGDIARDVSPAPKKTVAVLYFDNYTGKTDYDPLGKGIASMMISDLSVVEDIKLLERDRIQDIVKEIDRQSTKYFDSTTAVAVGKMAGAEYIVVGAFAAIQPKMRIDTRVVRVETGEVVKTAQVTGDENNFFDLEQKLAGRLIDGLGIALSPEAKQKLAAQQESNRIDALSTMVSFSKALALYDKSDFFGAAQMMAPAVQGAPKSALLRITYEEIKRRAAQTATDKAKEKIKSGLGGFLKRP